MTRRDPILVLVGCLTLLMWTTSHAQEQRQPVFGNNAEVVDAALRLTRTIELTAISMAEVLGMAPGASAARGSGPAATVTASASSLGAWRPGGTTATGVSEAAVIRRSVPDAWQMSVESTQRRRQHLDVAYTVRGASGKLGTLSHGADRGSGIGVRLESIPPTVLVTEGDFDVLQGGVVFYLDLTGVRRAGQYQGTLTVTFNNF